jgi:uncharacterized protein (DUF111 family)
VPAPATAHLLRGIPIRSGGVESELCTPTGAALLRYFAADFGEMPAMTVGAVGYGMGKKDFEIANCVRAMLGESAGGGDRVAELSCNVDDMTAEEIAYAAGKLFEGGALEVFTVPVGMKKGRPGTLIRALCREEAQEEILRLLFRHTTTIGVRRTFADRFVLERKTETLETPWGPVRRKVSCGYGVTRTKTEYEDLSRLADREGISLQEARALLGESK